MIALVKTLSPNTDNCVYIRLIQLNIYRERVREREMIFVFTCKHFLNDFCTFVQIKLHPFIFTESFTVLWRRTKSSSYFVNNFKSSISNRWFIFVVVDLYSLYVFYVCYQAIQKRIGESESPWKNPQLVLRLLDLYITLSWIYRKFVFHLFILHFRNIITGHVFKILWTFIIYMECTIKTFIVVSLGDTFIVQFRVAVLHDILFYDRLIYTAMWWLFASHFFKKKEPLHYINLGILFFWIEFFIFFMLCKGMWLIVSFFLCFLFYICSFF